MKSYPFEIHLQSDAEPASGLGTELLNSLLPRNPAGDVSIPGSHLKGVMRENLYKLLDAAGKDPEKICDSLFGRPGSGGDDGCPGILYLTSASVKDAEIITITRTKVGENGIAAEHSLRTTEALAAGTVLRGSLKCDSEDERVQKLCRFALMLVSSIGGSRTRGAGECRIVFPDYPNETPGNLYREVLNEEIKIEKIRPQYLETGDAGSEFKALKLHFASDAPICIPERPHGKNNVISSGFVIPGTAVAGTLLNILSEYDTELSSACYRSAIFRCYPLLPTADHKNCQYPVLVPNSHKISKIPLAETKEYIFGDQMIPDQYLEEDYRWQSKSSNISMKGANGVLQIKKDGAIELLRSGDIPRYYTAHGVVNGRGDDITKADNLFSMESISVKDFSGIVLLPAKAADILFEKLKDGRPAFFGKSKSTMGSGILSAEEFSLFADDKFPQVKQLKDRLFVVQTPVVFENTPGSSTMDVLNKVLAEAGWGAAEAESIMTSVLFGWNQLGIADQVNKTGRVKAKRVILPGSVFLLKEPLTDLAGKLAAGLGTDRYAGYGAVIPHPMFANRLCKFTESAKKVGISAEQQKSPVYSAYELHKECGSVLSASQIAMLLRQAQISKQNALDYIQTQKDSRPAKIWEKWKPVFDMLNKNIGKYTEKDVVRMLRIWHDLRVGEY